MKNRIISTFLSLSLCSGSLMLALDNPIVPPPVKSTGADAGQRIAAETATAITALGATPTAKQISGIVFKAVRSSPDDVLPIVNAAVRVSPQFAAPEIVTAAIAAVPNPWKQVIYRRLGVENAKESEPDYKNGPDGKQVRDGGPAIDLGGRDPNQGSGPILGEPGASISDGSQMSLAEAIVHTAFDAQPGLSFPTLQAAANIALATAPAALMRYIQSPIVVSGVGNAGFSNYANEPLRPPTQPVVSR
jgi:hypothetical protein